MNNIKRFNNWAGKYDRSLLQRFLFQKTHDELYKVIKSLLKDYARLLDIACGTGIFANKVQNYNCLMDIHGCDLSPKMIVQARRKNQAITWQTTPADSTPYKNDTFDIVTCTTAFHHFPNQQKAIKEMYRVLKPGGKLVIIDGNVSCLLGWIIYKIFVKLQEQQIYHPSAKGMVNLFKKAGFINIRQRQFNPIIPSLLTIGVKK